MIHLKNKFFSMTILFVAFLTIVGLTPVMAKNDGVSYQSHVENIGWQEAVTNGQVSGTTGQALRVEALKVNVINPDNLGIEYRAHVQNIGWQDFSADGQIAGTEGQALRLEALEMHLTGDKAKNYSVYYRVHVADYGWLDWAKDSQSAGTEGMGKRIEAVEVKLLPAAQPFNLSTERPYIKADVADTYLDPMSADANAGIAYRAYTNPGGWSKYATNGQELGGNQIEMISIDLSDQNYAKGGIEYKTLSSNGNWSNWTNNNHDSGSAGNGLQAVRIRLTGQLQSYYDVYYRVHVPNVGWSNFGRNGEAAGSEGYGRNANLIQIMLNEKGKLPGPTGSAFTQAKWAWPTPGYRTINSYFGPRGTTHHDGIDVGAPGGAAIVSAKAGTVILAGPAGNFGNCVAVEHDSGEVVYYAHMSRVASSVGQHVGQGELIGYVGTTGNSTGNHLHMEVYSDADELINPLNYY